MFLLQLRVICPKKFKIQVSLLKIFSIKFLNTVTRVFIRRTNNLTKKSCQKRLKQHFSVSIDLSHRVQGCLTHLHPLSVQTQLRKLYKKENAVDFLSVI